MRRNVLPNLQERQNASAEAKKAMLEKFRASPGPDDPAVVERRAAREAMLAERNARAAQREAAKRMKPNWPSERSVRPRSPRRPNGKPRKWRHGPPPSKPSARRLPWPSKRPPATSGIRRARQQKSSAGRVRPSVRGRLSNGSPEPRSWRNDNFGRKHPSSRRPSPRTGENRAKFRIFSERHVPAVRPVW